MKFPLFCCATACLTLASTALASPKISEIRLEDQFAGSHAPFKNNVFVFRANGDLYWLEGTSKAPIRHRYSCGEASFQKLVAAFKKSHFFSMKSSYDNTTVGRSRGMAIDHGQEVTLSVVQGGQTKKVVDFAGFGPTSLWELQMIVRGVASEHVDLRRSIEPDSKVTVIPARREQKEPTN